MVIDLGKTAILSGSNSVGCDILTSFENSILPCFQLPCMNQTGYNFDLFVLEILQQTI